MSLVTSVSQFPQNMRSFVKIFIQYGRKLLIETNDCRRRELINQHQSQLASIVMGTTGTEAAFIFVQETTATAFICYFLKAFIVMGNQHGVIDRQLVGNSL